MRVPPIPRLILYALGATLAIALVIALSTSGAAFGAYNQAWDGTSDVREIADTHSESTIALDVGAYDTDRPSETVAIILAPTEPYPAADADAVRQFVESGGTLLVADNFGPTEGDPPYGNTVLADSGATARFDGAQLRDEREYYQSPALPVANQVSEHPYTTGVDDLTLNYGTAVEPNDAETLVRTSEFAYLDRDRSGTLDDDEELTRYSVVTVESVGDGQVIAVGDPSVFINTMLNREGNTAFATALFQAHDQAIFDYSRSGSQPPLSVALLIFQETPLVQGLAGLLGVGLVWSVTARPGVIARLRDRVAAVVPASVGGHRSTERTGDQPSAPTEAELMRYLQDQYPEWEDARLRRIVGGIIQEESGTLDNE